MAEQTIPTLPVIGNLPIVFNRDGVVYANSRDVAAFFEKNHKDVLRDIDNLLENIDSAKLRSLIQETVYGVDGQTRTYRAVDLTKDGFTLLAMGFTGSKALSFKLAYIERFNVMEAALKQITPQMLAEFRHGIYAELADHRKATIELAERVNGLIVVNDARRAAIDVVSVKTLLEQAKCIQKGRMRPNRRIGNALREIAIQNAVTGCRKCANSNVWLFPIDFANDYMTRFGNLIVSDHNREMTGQPTLFPDEPKRRRSTKPTASAARPNT